VLLLEKLQSNALFEAIVAGGLDPKQCSLGIHGRFGKYPRVTHLPSQSYFQIGSSAPEGYVMYRLVAGGPRKTLESKTWDGVLERFTKWVKEVKMPDFWADLSPGQEFPTDAQYDDLANTPFTPDEQTEITEQLQAIKKSVKEAFSLTTEQMARVEARLDEADRASKRIGRKDWLLLFSGVVLTLIVTDFVPPDAAQHILTTALHGLGHLFGATRPRRIPPTT
jgi:hypothetical protein